MDKYIKSLMRLFMIVAILGISGIFSDVVAQEPMAEVAAETLVDTPTLDSGNTAWIMVATILVLLMSIPGIALFYGGLVRQKNVLSVIMQTLFIVGVVSILWVAFGYSWAFGTGFMESGNPLKAVIGGFDKVFLRGITLDTLTVGNIPELTFVMFQCMFAIITPALILGAFAERIKFSGYTLFIILWVIIAYFPMAHWVWGGGFLQQMGAIDFAGGTVVHINAGISALVMAIMLGKREDYRIGHPITPHNITFVFMGTSFLWLGWFGFNAGSALAADGLAAHAFVTTAVSSAAAMLSWMFCDVVVNKKPTFVGACTGMVAGLVGITPGAGFVPLWSSFIIGIVVSPICYFMMSVVKKHFGYDDALDAFGCHGIGGVWGGIATGLFAQKSINGAARWDGLFFGDYHLFVAQIISIVITIAVAIVGTLICAGIVKLFTPLRVSEHDERIGLDESQHGESAYPSFNGLD